MWQVWRTWGGALGRSAVLTAVLVGCAHSGVEGPSGAVGAGQFVQHGSALRVRGTVDAPLSGVSQLRAVRGGVVSWIDVGRHDAGRLDVTVTPEVLAAAGQRAELLGAEVQRFARAACRERTLTHTGAGGGLWFQTLYVDGQDGHLRWRGAWVDGVWVTRSVLYVYLDAPATLRGRADCDLETSAGPRRTVLDAQVDAPAGWSVLSSEGRSYPDGHLESTLRSGDALDVGWHRP